MEIKSFNHNVQQWIPEGKWPTTIFFQGWNAIGGWLSGLSIHGLGFSMISWVVFGEGITF